MNTDDFEQKLSHQPLRPVPTAWRTEILAAAQPPAPAQRPANNSWLSTLNSQLSTFFWPHPKAWAGLAAVWICIGVLNFSTREPAPRMAERSMPPSPEVLAELKKQQRMFAELVGSYEPAVADRVRIFSPRPRSERLEILAT